MASKEVIDHLFFDSTYNLLYSGTEYCKKTSFFRKTKNIIQTDVSDSLKLSNPDRQECLYRPKLIIPILLSGGLTCFILPSMALGFSIWGDFCLFFAHYSLRSHLSWVVECMRFFGKIQISQFISCWYRFGDLEVVLTGEKHWGFCKSPLWVLWKYNLHKNVIVSVSFLCK